MAAVDRALAAKRVVASLLKDSDGIRGIGIGWTPSGEPTVRVNIDFGFPAEELAKIPGSVDDVVVQIERRSRIELEA